MGCANCFELRKRLKDESSGCVCHACTVNEDYTGRRDKLCNVQGSTHRPTTQDELVWNIATNREPREFRSDHLLLHSWDLHDVLSRLDSRMINRLHCIPEFLLRNVDHPP